MPAKRGEVELSLVSIDSPTVRAHHDAAGTHLGDGVLDALLKTALLGRSTGGQTSKVHLAAEHRRSY